MNNDLEVFRTVEAIEKMHSTMEFLDHNDKEILSGILDRYQERIDKHNTENLEVVDASNTERGTLNAGIKARIMCTFFPKIKRLWCGDGHGEAKREKNNSIIEEIYESINQTQFSQHLLNAKLLNNRRSSYYHRDQLQKESNEMILSYLAAEYEAQNKEIINKYINYETSK